MDFTKYVALIESQALYFARADQFDDPFEGASTAANVKLRPEWYSAPDWLASNSSTALEILPKLYEGARRWTYINCWHANEVESAAMWKLYARSHEAIAIRSSYARLDKELPDNTYLGAVRYVDYRSVAIPDGNLFYRFLHKRVSFAHEREVRAIRQQPIVDGEFLKATTENPAPGILVPVDLAKVIDRVYVAPTSPGWFAALIERVTRKYSLEIDVVRSSLDDSPVY